MNRNKERVSSLKEMVPDLDLSSEDFWKILSAIPLFISIGVLCVILAILARGIKVLSFEFLFGSVLQDGIFEAIVGTIFLFAGTIVISLPLGLGAAIYLEKFAPKGSKIVYIINQSIDNLAGVPSIVIGLFGLTFFSRLLKFGKSLLSGWLTLTLMAFPIIVKGTGEAIDSVPTSYEEAALALGATKWEAIRDNTLPVAAPAIITSAILALVRVAGETAAILFTASVFLTRGIPTSPFDAVISLTYWLYVHLTEVPGGMQQAFGVALLLFIMVFILEVLALIVRTHYRKKMTGR
ncbi:MAG: phosphate ABC transporter permease PstA [Candidatus Korarchaeota archaeon]|nr:phosphate ABC transporter permease PstA [Candidatus Korarchaeota archaeon]NIU83231.1 phosphate ABC transporter permease PstA [Candidatus Thorarchaeota archaeon]NIW13177.1 phosphate ABC transporter permease PstA [Candidatus Thorarchaeota archaeon]NIW51318.1 phosphate ABC transporter permease PstA [Candidatus Korarchaeota archaeon]